MLLNVSSIYKAFGIDIILENVSFRLDRKEKIALVGRNGTGKTTLLKIITGQLAPDRGSVNLAQGAKIGYLKQENAVGPGRTVLEEAQSGIATKLELKRRLAELEAAFEAGEARDEDLDEYAALHEHLDNEESWSVDHDVESVLKKMGFEEHEFTKKTDSLSGGERTRLAIARLLLEEPDLLILDEPTNHLDLQATEWLEGWIRGYGGAVLLVSHDRIFLENTAQSVIELRQNTVKQYPGDFKKFLELRKEEDARQADIAAQQAHQIAKLDEYVRRFMNSQRTAQARGRQKLMNKLISQKVDAPTNDKGMAAGFGKVARSGDIVIQTERLSFGYPTNTLGKDVDWIVRIGERWGVIGENGAGKSTLIKTILGDLPRLSGTAKLGSQVVAGFFNQDAVDLDPEESPLSHIMNECDLEQAPARNLLGRFLIEGDDVFRPIGTLSGGEKNKLVLAELTQMNPNLLILDEPTNHLDMASRDALAEVLDDYKGTLVLISHDRQLLSRVTNNIIDVRKDGVKIYGGSYQEYRDRNAKPEAAAKKSAAPVVKAEPAMSPRELSKEISRRTKLVEDLEVEVGTLESQLATIERKLSGNPSADEAIELSQKHGDTQNKLNAKLSEWETASIELEKMRALQFS